MRARRGRSADERRAATLGRSREPARLVLLVAGHGPDARALDRSLRERGLATEWAHDVRQSALRAERPDLPTPELVLLDIDVPELAEEAHIATLKRRFAPSAFLAMGARVDGERAARLVRLGVPALNKPVSPATLAELACLLTGTRAHREQSRDSSVAFPPSEKGWVGDLESALASYAETRALSQQQRRILRYYLSGDNDKQIAATCACSEATVYEHWRRMGRKAGGSTKADAIADFHRHLVGQ